MNDIEKQEIDKSEPEHEGSKKSEAGADSTPASSQSSIAWIALVVAVVGSGFVYMQQPDLDDALQPEKQALADLKKQQQETKGRLDKFDQAISAEETAIKRQDEWLKRQTEEIEQSMELLYERIGGSSTQWIVAEAEYLMRIANHRLQLEGDSATALVALERADMRLRDTEDPAWTAVREKLAAEMAALKGLKQLDLAGQAAKLSGLISQVDKLKLPHSALEADEQPEVVTKVEKELSFDTLVNDFWVGFKSLIKVRRNDRPMAAMLEPDQSFFLFQNLRLQLEGARVALLQGDQSLFDASLQRVDAWVKEFFDQEHAITKSMLEGVDELRKLKLESEMPDISGSIRMLLGQQGKAVADPKQDDVGQIEAAEEMPALVEKKQNDVEQKEAKEESTPVEEKQELPEKDQDEGEMKPPSQEPEQQEQKQGESNSEQKVVL